MIGPTFDDEIRAAGLGGLPFSWSDDGTIRGREGLTIAQNRALDAVLAAHDPSKNKPVRPQLADVIAVLSPVQQQAIKAAVSARQAETIGLP